MSEPLRKIDLNLLLIFDIIYRERSITTSALQIGLTQSAVSLALNRLRFILNDSLFIWDGRTMQPTGRCEEVAPSIMQIINQIRETVLGNEFSPKNIKREFSIATADYFHWLLGGSLTNALSTEAPDITLSLIDVKPEMLEGHAALQNEFFVLPADTFNTVGLNHQQIFEDRYIGICARGNPLVYEGMDAASFFRLPQASFSTNSKIVRSHEAKFLENADVKMSYKIITPHYTVIPHIIAQTQIVAVMQERLARYFASFLPLQLFIPPVQYPELLINLYWHPSYDGESAHKFLRMTIANLAGQLEPLPHQPFVKADCITFV